MGCAVSKKAAPVTPIINSSRTQTSGELLAASGMWNRQRLPSYEFGDRSHQSRESGKESSTRGGSVSYRLTNLHRYIEGEQVAAGWPAWLSSAAPEAIQGWLPLKAEKFEKLEKIGQGTYSSVFKGRDVDTGKLVALKKLRLETFEPDTVKFVAREIQFLRKLNHPNIIKLNGLITSRVSYSLYLVFEYMEHDLAGLLSSPDIKFTDPQIKCYMQQIFSGLDHCHSHGIMHRDIKCANLLVNNEGNLKIADFGLANLLCPAEKQPLTSRVVTLWYRSPELLLGSTDYDTSIDMWSAGCLLGELYTGKPILQGRTEVEQIQKIFKLCGSPSEEYWRKSRLLHAAAFKPQQPYESVLRQRFEFLSDSAFRLLSTLLSFEPYYRGTASTALASEYFRTEPYACDPSSLPKCPPAKEIDAKLRKELNRRRVSNKFHGDEGPRRRSKTLGTSKEWIGQTDNQSHKKDSGDHQENISNSNQRTARGNHDKRLSVDEQQSMPSIYPQRYAKQTSQDRALSGPLHGSSSGGFSLSKSQKDENLHITYGVRSKPALGSYVMSVSGVSRSTRNN